MACNPNKLKLLEGGEIHDQDAEVAEDFGKYFSSIVENLDIPRRLDSSNSYSLSRSDPILSAISRYENHHSILKIKQSVGENASFSFSRVSENTVRQEISSLVKSKATPISSIPPSILKDHIDIFAEKIQIDFNESIINGIFPNNLKYADVSPIFKTGDPLDKSNYRPISILPAVLAVSTY